MIMKLPSDETQANMNGDGYLSDEFDQLEMMPAPIRDGDFSEYMWMENEEEFNSQVLRQLEEEELMEQCIVAMLDDEDDFQVSNNNSRSNANGSNPTSRNSTNGSSVSSSVNGLSESVTNLSISSNGVQNNSNASSDNNSATTNSSNARSFNAQDRLRRFRSGGPPANRGETAESEHKVREPDSTLNPDAKEFVPVPRNAMQSQSRNENVSS